MRFDFAEPVSPDRVVVTTAPTRPYRLHSLRCVAKSPAGRQGVGDRHAIWILSASYGCNQGAPTGNATAHVADACNGKTRCTYGPDHVLVFRCRPSGEARQLALQAPAGFGDKTVTIDCGVPGGWVVDWPPPPVDPDADKITVLSATYGGNQGAADGNVTARIAEACNGKRVCDYPPNYRLIGDPAPGKSKDYRVRYRCGQDGEAGTPDGTANKAPGGLTPFEWRTGSTR